MTEKCPTCGSVLHVETSKEGTSFFHAVDVGSQHIKRLAEAFLAQRGEKLADEKGVV